MAFVWQWFEQTRARKRKGILEDMDYRSGNSVCRKKGEKAAVKAQERRIWIENGSKD